VGGADSISVDCGIVHEKDEQQSGFGEKIKADFAVNWRLSGDSAK